LSFSEMTLNELLERFGSSSPTPGGGSAAALAASMGASLVAMAARLTAGKKRFADRKKEMEAAAGKASGLASELERLVTEDGRAYDGVMQAFRLPKETDEQKAERSKAIQEATKRAAEVPLETMRKAVECMETGVAVAARCNPNCVTDAVAGVLLMGVGVEIAKLNVCINLDSIKDEVYAARLREELADLSARGTELGNAVRLAYNGGLCGK